MVYIVTLYFFWGVVLYYILPAFILSFVWKELLIMTQHTHIEIPISKGENVKPISFLDQVKYTRSFDTFAFVSRYFHFNFNLHEAHHAFPGVPAYWLDNVDLDIPREPTFSGWLIKAKSMKGVDYIFRTSKFTGIEILRFVISGPGSVSGDLRQCHLGPIIKLKKVFSIRSEFKFRANETRVTITATLSRCMNW